MRVLHLIESIDGPPCDTSLALLRDLIRAQPDVAHRIGAIGSPALRRRLASAGLDPAWHLTVPHGQGWLAVPRLWRRLRREREKPADLLHAWSPRGAMLAGLMGRWTRQNPGRPLATLSHPLRHPLAPRLRWLLRWAPCPVLTLSPEAEAGFRAGGLDVAPLHPVEPGIDPARIAEDGRAELRMSWGVPDEQTPIIAAVGEPPETVDALTALLSVGMVRETGRPVRLLASPRAEGLRRAARIAGDAGRGELLTVSPLAEQPWRIMPGIDLVLAMGAGLSTAWTMAGAKPIVAPDAPDLRHQLTDDETALLGPPGKAGEMARRLIQLIEQPERGRRLAERAQREATQRYDPARHAERMTAVYRAILENRPLPDPANPTPAQEEAPGTTPPANHNHEGPNHEGPEPTRRVG